MKAGDIVKPAIVLLAVCLVITLALAFTYDATKDTIDKVSLEKANSTRQDFFPEATTFVEETVPADAVEINSIFSASGTDGLLGYIVSAASSGYGGAMEVMVGINVDGTISNVRMTSHSETPGLGTNANNDSFKEQYYVGPQGEFYVVKSGKSADEQILALSGATITSKAVTKAVNNAYNCYILVGGAN